MPVRTTVVAVGDCPFFGGLEQSATLEGAKFAGIIALGALPHLDPEDALEELLARPTKPLVIVADPCASTRDAARWTRHGAFDVAVDAESLASALDLAFEHQVTPVDGPVWSRLLVGPSEALDRARQIVGLAGPRRATVLISGETGTGKELLARALHLASPRAAYPMITVNAAALPENLLEAELFGHVKGAFTGAVHQRVGRFEQAHRSTLFLDEIGDLPLALQTKLLRFLQEREFQRIGSSETVRVDVRLIAATNVDLKARVAEGRFRADLYYRLNVVPLEAPPLRVRPDDIGPLAQHFVEKVCRAEEVPSKFLTPEAVDRLRLYDWPGNVRQLENAIEMAVALSGPSDLLVSADFAAVLGPERPVVAPSGGEVVVPDSGLDYEGTVGNIERQILSDALRKTGGNKSAAAEMLGLKRTTLSAKLRSLACGTA